MNIKMNHNVYIAIIILIFNNSLYVYAYSFFVAQVPNGAKFNCLTCHMKLPPNKELNPFGEDVKEKFIVGNNVDWNEILAALDSDGDGFTNGEELQDNEGKWKTGYENPGDFSLVTNPGDSSTHPANTSIGDDSLLNDIMLQMIEWNHTENKFFLKIFSDMNSLIEINIYDLNARFIIQKTIQIQTGYNSLVLAPALQDITDAVYFFIIRSKKYIIFNKVLVY